MANGLAKEIEREKEQLKQSMSTKRPESSRSAPKNQLASDKRPPVKDRSKLQLPDVTGITNAIESPARATAEYYAYRTEGRLRETESKLAEAFMYLQF
jgi:hypothetical protein